MQLPLESSARNIPWEGYCSRRYSGSEVSSKQFLMFSGFSGSCFPLDPLAQELHAKLGFKVAIETLAGHTGNPKDFGRSRAWHYRRTGVDLSNALYEESETPMIVAGFSIGSLVAAYYALKHPERVRGLVMVSPAFKFANPYSGMLSAGVIAAHSLAPYVSAVYDAYRISSVASAGRSWRRIVPWTCLGAIALRVALERVHLKRHDPQVWETPDGPVISPHYDALPLVTVASLFEFQLRMAMLLRRLKVPTLVILGEQDHVINVASARRAVAQIESVRVEMFPSSGHQVMLGGEQRRYLDTILNFCEERWS